jgi:signal peptidase II
MGKIGKYFLFTFVLILIDQTIKLWMHYVVVPQHFGNIDLIPNFFKLHYVPNNGMAFGIELEGTHGKLLLSFFRLLATLGIGWYLYYLAKNMPSNKLIWAVAAILAGAIGNVIDGVFYGKFIQGNLAPGAPYAWFHGQVIDMFYFYFLDGFWPDWVPYFGGQYHSTPIFNFADACIFCGVVTLLIFQKNFFEVEPEKKQAIPSDLGGNTTESLPLGTNE